MARRSLALRGSAGRPPVTLLSLASGLLIGTLPAAAQTQTLDGIAAPGFSGLGMTPSARPAAWGQVLLGYDQSLPGHTTEPRGHSFMLATGLLPGLEVSARLATNDLNCNGYGLGDNPCRGPTIRDLSGSFKLGHSLRLSAWPGLRLSAAVGATDLGGAATNNRAWYGVLGADHGRWSSTVGWAKAHSVSAALDGGFASLAWRAHETLQLQAEAVGSRRWVGARATLPAAWRPAHLQPWLQWQTSLQDDRFTPRHAWSAGLSMQLDAPGASGMAALAELVAARPTAATDEPPASAWPLPAQATTRPGEAATWARSVAEGLAAAGFDDIAIGQSGDTLVVEAENGAWRWSDADALGVALGRLSGPAPQAPARLLELRLLRQGVRTWRVRLPWVCLDDWLAARACQAAPQAQPQLQAGAMAQRGGAAEVQWWLRNHNPGWMHPRLELAPDLDTRVGTEYGTLDSTWGLAATLMWPLWRGATADIAYVKGLAHSADYGPGREFADFRIDTQWYRAMLHQVAELGPGLSGRVSVGRLFRALDGGQAELRWSPGDGRHRLGLATAMFNHKDVDFQKRSTLGSYRYMVQPLQTALELHGGRFWHGDRGALAVSRHWFGDVSVALYLRRTQFGADAPALYSPYGPRWVNAAGIEFSFPLTLRRDVQAGSLRLRGAERWGYGVQSVVGQKNTNYLSPWHGRFTPVPMALDAAVHNMDRNSQGWLDRQHGRIREAAGLPPDD